MGEIWYKTGKRSAGNIDKLMVMKYIARVLMFYILLLVSCAEPSHFIPEVIKYNPVKVDYVSTDTLNLYHILTPSNLEMGEKIPFLLVIDAHGDGEMAVERFQPAVQFFPIIVAGSDLIENNFVGYENAIYQIIEDVYSKYPIDKNEIYISGFSGGARMAYNYSLNHQLKGLLMCGAGPGKQLPSCPVYTISGMGDFNFAENFVSPSIKMLSDTKFATDYFSGNHEWPPASQLSDGLLFLFSKNTKLFGNLIEKRSAELFATADSLEKAGNMWMAWLALKKTAILGDNEWTRKATVQAEKLLENEAFISTVQSLEKNLKTEAALQKAFAQKSMTEDFIWWKNELNVLNDNLEKFKGGMQADHYLRIKGFIGILLYTRLNNLIYNDIKNPQIKVLLEVYKYAEPENSYAYYFQALYDFQNGNSKSCLENLEKSINLGFTDYGKMNREFSENIVLQLQNE